RPGILGANGWGLPESVPAMRPIRFATFLAPNMLPVYEAVAAYVGRCLGVPTELAAGERFSVFADGEADVGFICGLPYVELMGEREPSIELLAAPVLAGERYQQRPIYFSDVIVRREQPWRRFADLRGCSWAYNDTDSHSGYNVTRYALVRLGETRGFFGRLVEAGYHQRSLRLVAAGEVDASAIDSQVLAIESREHPELAERVRVIDTLGPSSIQPVVAARCLPATLKADLRAALLGMAEDAEARERLAHGYVSHFAAVEDHDYDDIRAMVAAAEAVGFLALR
ncbi:MAG TPA: PhnD/SsuA/transferrin family substrate-binding protein, partial [Ktedonobacterales bacterium]|nr:PhnD/SsuA/transferrin family substrate-binding protein [Ktedonobacterales bacterium]